MNSHLAVLVLLLAAGLPGGSVVAQGGLPRVFPVLATRGNVSFFESLEFQGSPTAFPGIQRGVLSFGGHPATAVVTERIPIEITRVETYYVDIIVDGQLRREARERVVRETIYLEQQVPRTIYLPLVTGRWQALDFNYFSWWNCFAFGRTGLIAGGGTTTEDRLSGTIVCLGVDGLPWGVYQLTSGHAGEGGEEPPP
jgi:hypothetical protein